ncbi:MAG: hypothetical protein HZR80_05480 [Candidatus Heimdallarchaeota archaeon]
MSKDKRKKELEKEIERLRKKLDKLDVEGTDFEEYDDFDPFIKGNEPMPPLPPKPGLPPRPPKPAKPARPHSYRVAEARKLTSEQKKRIAKERELLRRKREDISKELHAMKSNLLEEQRDLQSKQREFKHIRKELRNKERKIREKEHALRDQKHSSYTWDLDMDEDIEGITSDLEVRLGDYTRSILASVADSIKTSMGITVRSAGDIGKEIKIVGDDIGKIGSKITRDVHLTIGPRIPEKKLEEFYEIGSKIVSAIGDHNRLKILKELEKAPKYQKELSDITSLRGGTFKHHMDRLLDKEVKFVTQEVVRGRYLLTTRGREALKLAEIQFMRYLEEKKRAKVEGKNMDSDEEFDVRIK